MEGNGRMGMDKRKYMIMKICIFQTGYQRGCRIQRS